MIPESHPILSCDEAKHWEAQLFGGDEAKEWNAMQKAGCAIAEAVLRDRSDRDARLWRRVGLVQ